MGELFFLIGVIIAIVRGLIAFFRWASRGLTKLSGPAPTFTPQAMTPQPQRPPQQPQRPALGGFSPASLPPRTDFRTVPARRPDAGGLAVTKDATTTQFRAQEEQIQRTESEAYLMPSASDALSPTLPPNRLFANTDNLVRAIILQEVLGPPLSKRHNR